MNETFFSLWEMMEKVRVEDVGKGSLEGQRDRLNYSIPVSVL